MISLRKIRRLRISPFHSQPTIWADSKSIPICNRLMRNGNIDRRSLLDSLYSYVIDLDKWFTEDQIARLKRADIYDEEERYHRRLATRYFMIRTIRILERHFWDVECTKTFAINNFTGVREKINHNTWYDYWTSFFEYSETPLAIELQKKVQKSGIPYQEFCDSILKIYSTLDGYYYGSIIGIYVTPEDVIDTINHLGFNHKQYECLKILFSVHKIYGIKI